MFRIFTPQLTYNVKVTNLTLHRVGVDLTHIPALIGLAHFPYVEVPSLELAVGHPDSVVLRDYVIMYRKNGLCVHSQPRHL